MSKNEDDRKLMYQPFSSILNPGFWRQLTNVKLNKLKLSKDPVDIHGSYSCNLSDTLPCLASFDHSSFDELSESGNKASCPLYGQLTCTNVMQEFLDQDKKRFLDNYGNQIWNSIRDGRALQQPEKYLSKFGLLVYADLKKYKFFYWFCFPAVNYPKDVHIVHNDQPNLLGNSNNQLLSKPVLNFFSEQNLKALQNEYDKPQSQRAFQRGFFIVKHFINSLTNTSDVSIFSLAQYEMAIQLRDNERESSLYFAYTDPSANQLYPGWPLRNYLALIAFSFKLDHIKLLRIRKGQATASSKLELQHSMVIEVSYQLDPIQDEPLITGWEKNESQQMAPKRVNLSSLLDPKKLAEDAVNLNLRLMKWRLLPSLDLDKIADTKCLILGCGTLGCHIARGLLAWGVKELTIVDNAKVSYSNPVRQTLYTFDDCSNVDGAFKAKVAASSLRKIHPSVIVKDFVLSIPMPGHHIADKEIEQTKKDVSHLENLIDNNDAVFLLMDTRESRWLPTVIAMSKQKLVINAAIGFDTFLLQRYGIRNYNLSNEQILPKSSINDCSSVEQNLETSRSASGNEQFLLPSDQLGCYFCNDIVAPGDSTLDRTLDQQCTVSRPGVSMMVSAMAVELFASIVSSRDGAMTPAPVNIKSDYPESEDSGSELGIIPHSIRGNVARYHVYMPTSPLFNKCAACSQSVVNAYINSDYEFLQRVFDDPNYLEEVAGLKDLQNVSSDNVWAIDSDDEADESQFIECAVNKVTL